MQIFLKLGLILSFFFSALAHGFVPTVTFDAAAPGAAVSSRASGHLYGLAEAEVPSALTVRSLDIASVSQKVPGGLQHPTGDLDHVAGMLPEADYLVTYLQDDYDTWYYDHEAILEARAAGTYDPRVYLREDYFPRIARHVPALAEKDYADRVVLCPFNECDNGLWFGETKTGDDGNVWGEFNEAGRDAFFAAWKETFAYVRSLAPSLLIGGPGYYEYNAEKERDFLSFCAENNCLPDVMIWHELGGDSGRLLPEHVAEYRELEAELGTDPLPVIVTEYGAMSECGDPGEMIRYVCGIETAGVYGNIAYWRLADNLNENAADDNTPSACWWLYRWYADLEGSLLPWEKSDLFHADFAKAVREQRPLKYKTFYALGCLNDARDGVTVLCGACDYAGRVTVKNLDATALGSRVRVRIEEVQYAGLGGAVLRPTLLKDADVSVRGGRVSVRIPGMREGAVYRVTLAPADGGHDPVDVRPRRYEAENGELLGGAYLYRSAYAATGETEKRPENLVGGMENPGDGVVLTVWSPRACDCDLDIVYGKHNDGDGPAGRVTGSALLNVSCGKRYNRTFTLSLPNTIKSEYTACVRQRIPLTAGKNRLRFELLDGTFVLDSILLTRVAPQNAFRIDFSDDASEGDPPAGGSVRCDASAFDAGAEGSLPSGLTVTAKRAGIYEADILYAAADAAAATLFVNGEAQPLSMPGTGGTDRALWAHAAVSLRRGENLLRVDGAADAVFRELRLSRRRETLALLPEPVGDGGTGYLAVAPADGYYGVFCDTASLSADGARVGRVDGSAPVYLRRGLNLLELAGADVPCRVSALPGDPARPVLPEEMALSGSARVGADGLLTGISSAGGAAAFTVSAPAAGDYRVTLCYANNAEGGFHDYNVDLIEAYYTVTVNGEPRTVMCRSTYSEETFSTVTFSVSLQEGDNAFLLANDGAVLFAGRDAVAPVLRWVRVNPVTTE